ncbi:branched-chain amino acid ABC transporter permease [Lampropedia aestuarii]|uniref:branched-chain amino acid ABC transporter permease n=1 Tax=Lampropedia aestuarii TaxID=2562762 RepID=UPI0024683A99|nr:branched-chain amino acid ABC transporter permease [Lampropedia aestuarii]MDH5856117.1 branched-chain amino acid ABC transporter permease [Lampropedia aestuarii]
MLQFFIDTLMRTSDLALVALGLSMLYGLVKFPNIAHVQYAMVGAFLAYWLHGLGLPLALALVLGAVLTGLLTLLVQLLVFDRLLQSGPAIAMIGSLAVSMLLVAMVLGVAGSFPHMFVLPNMEPVVIGDARLSRAQLWMVLTTAALLVVFLVLLFYTQAGRAMRALASNRALADASGLNASRITNVVTLLSGALAGLGGGMLAISGGAHVNLGNDMLLPVFAAAILGGLGNPIGAVAGAFLIALAETTVTNINFGPMLGESLVFLPASYIGAAAFLILLLTLLFKPYGLFDKEVRRV